MSDVIRNNALGLHAPCRNDYVGEHPEVRAAAVAPVDNNQDASMAGLHGLMVLQDVWFKEMNRLVRTSRKSSLVANSAHMEIHSLRENRVLACWEEIRTGAPIPPV